MVISVAAMVNMAECEMVVSVLEPGANDTNIEPGCNCTNWTIWNDAVNNPDPDDSSCQFPQVGVVMGVSSIVELFSNLSQLIFPPVFLLQCHAGSDRFGHLHQNELDYKGVIKSHSFHSLCGSHH